MDVNLSPLSSSARFFDSHLQSSITTFRPSAISFPSTKDPSSGIGEKSFTSLSTRERGSMADDLCTPPFQITYKSLLDSHITAPHGVATAEELDLPLIDLCDSNGGMERCTWEMASASSEWGFFQVVNHGVPSRLISRMRREQESLFRQPFEKKANEMLSDFSSNSYRWGVPSATRIEQLSWSEAYHLPLTPSSTPSEPNSLRRTIDEFASALSCLAQRLARLLARQLGYEGHFFEDNCKRDSCYLRLNRYPPCPVSMEVNGMIPHTDSDFLTLLYQDQVGGLQVMKDGRWIAVRPRPDALIVNIGDLFQVWSNGVYKSVEHKVVSNPKRERFSMAYFFCPSYDAVIESFCAGNAIEPVYKRFSFKEYRETVQEDVRVRGYKVGLSRFLA